MRRLFVCFSAAAWNWDEVCRVLILAVVTRFVPGIRIWLVGMTRFATNVEQRSLLGESSLMQCLAQRSTKCFASATIGYCWELWFNCPFARIAISVSPVCGAFTRNGERRVGATPYQEPTRGGVGKSGRSLVSDPQNPGRGRLAYVGQHLLQGREPNVEVIGPIRWDAALTTPVPPDAKKGRKKGDRLPTPAQILANYDRWPAQDVTLKFPKGKRRLLVKVVKDVCWYQANGPQCVQLILVRDPEGKWRNEALLSTDDTLTPGQVITGYCRRWSVEAGICDAKQMLGFHDPQVWCEKSIESLLRCSLVRRFAGGVVVCNHGYQSEQARRHRPWYKNKPKPTFADMLAACRLHLWRHWLANGCASHADKAVKWEWLWELGHLGLSCGIEAM